MHGKYKEINVNRHPDIILTAIHDILLSFKNKKEFKFMNNLTGTGCHSSKHLYQKLICETYKEFKKNFNCHVEPLT